MKAELTVLVTVCEDIIVRNIIQTKAWDSFLQLAEGRKWRVVVAVSPLTNDVMREIAGSRFDVVEYKPVHPGRIENMVMTVARSSLATHTNLWSKMRSYYRGDSSFAATYTKRILTATLGRLTLFKRLVRFCISQLPKESTANALLLHIQPDVIVPLSLTNFIYDVPMVRTSRTLGIPVVGMVRSWDNLSSHGLLRVVPDALLLQNEFLRDMAEKYQDMRPEVCEMKIVGVPHYDHYVEGAKLSREEFCTFIGADPEKKIVLYGAMGEFLFQRERDLPRIFERTFEESGIGAHACVLYRSHPKFIPTYEVGDLKHVIITTPGSYSKSEDKMSPEQLLKESLYHADVVVTGGSTFAIDAFVMHKPVICVGFDSDGSVPYWESVARFYDTYTHFEDFLKTSHVPVANSAHELQEMIEKALKGRHSDSEYIHGRTIERFVFALDGHSSERFARGLVDTIERVVQKK